MSRVPVSDTKTSRTRVGHVIFTCPKIGHFKVRVGHCEITCPRCVLDVSWKHDTFFKNRTLFSKNHDTFSKKMTFFPKNMTFFLAFFPKITVIEYANLKSHTADNMDRKHTDLHSLNNICILLIIHDKLTKKKPKSLTYSLTHWFALHFFYRIRDKKRYNVSRLMHEMPQLTESNPNPNHYCQCTCLHE